MMKALLLLSLALPLASCGTLPLDAGGQTVRITTNTPQNCQYLGQVTGHCYDAGKQGGLYLTESDEEEAAYNAIKNATAKMGGDTVEVMGGGYRSKQGEAYKCGRAPASK